MELFINAESIIFAAIAFSSPLNKVNFKKNS
jgi:hypothetical protein